MSFILALSLPFLSFFFFSLKTEILTLPLTLTLAISDKAKAEKLGSKNVCVHSAKTPVGSQANALSVHCSQGLYLLLCPTLPEKGLPG